MEHPHETASRRPWARPWWYRGFTGRRFDFLDAFAVSVLALTLLLVILGIAGVL